MLMGWWLEVRDAREPWELWELLASQ